MRREGLWHQECLSSFALANEKMKRNVGDFYLELIFAFFWFGVSITNPDTTYDVMK